MHATASRRRGQRPPSRADAPKPLPAGSGKVLSLLIALEALRQHSYALGAQKV